MIKKKKDNIKEQIEKDIEQLKKILKLDYHEAIKKTGELIYDGIEKEMTNQLLSRKIKTLEGIYKKKQMDVLKIIIKGEFLNKLSKNYGLDLSNKNDIDLFKFASSLFDETNKIPDTLKISQNHSTNTAKGIFSSLTKNRIEKDSNYKVSKKEDYYIVEYQTKTGKKKEYKTTIGIKDVPTIKLIDDITFNKFFTFIHYQFNINNSYLFNFNSNLFLEFLGKENPTKDQKKRVNSKINKYCKNILSHIQLKWEKRGNQSKTITPFPNIGISNSIVTIGLEVSYADELKNSFYEVPKEIGLLNENAYLIADYIYIYARKAKKDKFNLKNQSLYKVTGLPTYEEIINSKTYKGDTNKSIKKPFYKAIEEIKNVLNHKIIINYKNVNTEKWEDFLKEKINFEITDYGNTVVSMKEAQNKKIKKNQTN